MEELQALECAVLQGNAIAEEALAPTTHRRWEATLGQGEQAVLIDSLDKFGSPHTIGRLLILRKEGQEVLRAHRSWKQNGRPYQPGDEKDIPETPWTIRSGTQEYIQKYSR